MRSKIQPTKRKTAKTRAATKRATAKKAPAKTAAAKKTAAKPAAKETAKKKVSALDAAVQVVTEAKTPMTTAEMIEAMATKGIWTSPGGKTPDRTLYSAILREIATKGKDARFQKTERGKFGAA